MKFYFKQIVPDRIGAGLGILLAAAYALGWLGGPALADDITWTNPSQLAEEPSEGGQGFFPGTSLTGNTVTVNSGPDLIGGVYGAVTGGDEAVRHNQVFVSGTANITEGVAGAVSGGEASENYAEISGGEFDALAGGLSMRSRADNNEILMTGGRVLGPEGIAGGLALGFSGQGGVSGNKVTFGGTAYSASYLLSGYVRNGSGNAEKNSLIINGGTVGTSAGYFHGAYGGMVEQPDSAGSALSNEVLMTGGTIFGHLFGGAALGEGRAEANQVTMTGGLLNSSDRGSSLYGGFAMSGDALRNKVYFEGGQVLGDEDSFAGGAIGGFSYGGAVRGNEVYVSGGELEWAPAGGITMGAAPAEDNSVTVSGGNMTVIIGGFSMGGDASGNSITLTGGNVSESLASGLTVTGAVHHNQVLVTGGNLGFGVPDGGIAGGLSMYGGENYANTVTVTGGTIKGAVSGGMMQFDGAAHDNTVTISGAPDLTGASLYGGYYEGPPPFTGDLFSGNTLNVWGYSGTAILEAGNFETYNFLLPRIQPSAPLLEASGTVVLGDGFGRSSRIELDTRGAGGPLQPGYRVTVIRAGTLDASDFAASLVGGTHGGVLEYYWDASVTSTALSAELTAVGASPASKALSEGMISSLGILNSAADLSSGLGMARAQQAAVSSGGSLAGFSGAQAGSIRYNSGSHVDAKSFSFMTGLAFLTQTSAGDLTLGGFFEAGTGDFDSYNSFPRGAEVHGTGDTSYLGGGLMFRLDLGSADESHFHTEISARAGQVKTSLNPADLGLGNQAGFDLKTPYFGAHLGAGYLVNVSPSLKVDLYGQYLWNRQKGDETVMSNGIPLEFKAVSSHRLRTGARAEWAGNSFLSPYAGAAWEYEFDGEAEASAFGVRLPAPSVKGSTGLAEAGLTLKPAGNFHIDLHLTGYAGKREGLSGGVHLKYVF